MHSCFYCKIQIEICFMCFGGVKFNLSLLLRKSLYYPNFFYLFDYSTRQMHFVITNPHILKSGIVNHWSTKNCWKFLFFHNLVNPSSIKLFGKCASAAHFLIRNRTSHFLWYSFESPISCTFLHNAWLKWKLHPFDWSFGIFFLIAFIAAAQRYFSLIS